jgi:hypothetical protein
MIRKTLAVIAASASLLAAAPASAATVAWTDWVSSTNTVATGTIASTSNVGITLSTSGEDFFFVQTGTGTNFFTEGAPAPFTGGSVSNAPPAAEMVALGTGGTKTIRFSQFVTDPYIAFVSWNGNLAAFSQPFQKVSEGCGFWGCGTFSLGAGNSFVGVGEAHGLLRFLGTFDTISFTDNSEAWHGLTVGIGGVAPPMGAVPEPGTWAMMIGGFGMVGGAMRMRRARKLATA